MMGKDLSNGSQQGQFASQVKFGAIFGVIAMEVLCISNE